MPPKRTSARQAARAQASTAPAETVQEPRSTRAKSTRALRSRTADYAPAPQSVRAKRKGRDASQESVDLGDRPDQRGNKRAKQNLQKSGSTTQDPRQSPGSISTIAPGETQDTPDLEIQDTTAAVNSQLEDREAADSLDNTQTGESFQDGPDLPDVRSPALTGTTARDSYVAQLQDELDPQRMVDELPELWESSKRLVHLLTPLKANLEGIMQLKEDLRDPNSLESRNRIRYRGQFYTTLEAYGRQNFMDVSRTGLALFREAGIREMSEVVDASLRVEDVLFMANLATLVDIDSLATRGVTSHEWWEHLDREFPLPFLTEFGNAVDKSVLSTKSFELALFIRLQHFKSIVVAHSDREDFNAEEAFISTFFDSASSDRVYKGWSLEAWSDGNLNDDFKALLSQKVEDLQAAIREYNDSENDDLIAKLERLIHNEAFCLQFNEWASLRGKEIEEGFKSRHTGDIGGLQKDLDSMLKGSMASSIRVSISAPARRANPPSPTAPRGRSSVPNVAHRWNTNQNTAPNRQIVRALIGKPTANGSMVPRPDTATVESAEDASPISSKNAPSAPRRIQKVRSRRAVREGTTNRRFLDTQPNAQQVPLIDEGQDSQNGDNEEYVPPNSDEQDKENAQQDESEDDDEHFQSDNRPQIVKRRGPGRPRKHPPSASDQASSARPLPSSRTHAPGRANHQQSVRAASQVASLSQNAEQEEEETGQAAAEGKPVQFRAPRRPWTAEEDDALIEALNQTVNDLVRYRSIRRTIDGTWEEPSPLDRYREDWQPLARRTNVNMKDRARHLKIKFIKAGDTTPMPPGLVTVPIKAQDVTALHNQGYTWEQPTGADPDDAPEAAS